MKQFKPSLLPERLICVIIFVLILPTTYGQRTPPAPYAPGVKVNYIRTWQATAPEQNPSTLIGRDLKDVRQTTNYLDGLGRLLQTVIKKGAYSPEGATVDLISPFEYDGLGREAYKYLPFSANAEGGNTSLSDGLFKFNPFQQQAAFSASQYPGETYYYGQKQYEPSPLNRILKTMAPGNSWVGANRGTEGKYWTNTAIDDVKVWDVNDNASTQEKYTVTGTYAAGTLFKNVTVDEDGHQVIEFIDKENRVVLRKILFDTTPDDGSGRGHTGFSCTYYIYDLLGNLRCVIQPEGVKLLSASGWLLNDADIQNEQCFLYEYDSRNRMITKKVPGASEVFLVYDVRDRLVLTQDGNLRSTGKWKANLYDALNRELLSGIITYNGNREQLQALVTLQTGGGTSNGGAPVVSDLTINTPSPSGLYVATNSITLDAGFESDDDSELTFELINSQSVDDDNPVIIEGMAINRNPLPTGSNLEPLVFTYYDNYQWTQTLPSELKDFETNSIGSYLLPASNLNYPYPQPVSLFAGTNGLVTGTKV